ncbi:hypothetical protein GLOIN_2v1521212 [Rhizophagus irregularis DAOM 181602=DAOM 197198]|uniref:Uncharacterized protein n=1 Tax=Rhizophagus irregularis (strain DAOM 181602 / DAOM 197198 / MUCL 43194) TaxID=747089 RepID=U9UCL5_RHIID|nr:hypothetical protein GLOIN_2v1521212 [Rhizophagus irregularis DAOM 181602=DAOM 197198]POG80061.1 hypothetical protein GLOIN_2v1521212 [Rhizophagus irregularis DAOM 181602=DAOM 197198]|eukprot:XP_025186927.1 hypothetical protein GLOIN_2v1521212 [Rhizophagus irregularis DAOM 181602=DAOM 197198]
MRNIISCTTRPKIRNLSPRSKNKILELGFSRDNSFSPEKFLRLYCIFHDLCNDIDTQRI